MVSKPEKSKHDIRVLILAAGRGRRLMPYTADRPKCLVEVGGRPILFYQLRALEKHGIENVVIVVGYQAEKIKDYVRDNFSGLKVEFVYNPDYLSTNDIYSLYLARSYLNDGVIILDSDVLFHSKMLSELSEYHSGRSAICVRVGSCGDEEMKVGVNSKGMVVRLSKGLPPEETVGESMGISFFSDKFSNYLSRTLEKIIDMGGILLYREAAIERVISEHAEPLHLLNISRYPAIEIDFPEDIERAEKEILPQIIGEFKLTQYR